MSLTIEEAITWIHNRLAFGLRPGLDRVESLLEKVGNPEKKIPTIHIAGTNGKGSTVTYLKCMLEAQGLKVGTFTSPYIELFNERIAINENPIPDELLIKYVEKYQPLINEMDQQPLVSGITEFELLTVMGLEYFYDQSVDIAIVEVGLGGLLDSTNVVSPLLTAITTIGKDHTDVLGNTIEEIAFQKAGIIKKNIPVVTGKMIDEALNVIYQCACSKQSAVYRYGQEYQVKYLHPDQQWGEVFDFYGEEGCLKSLKIPLLGQHQVENAAVAIELFFLYCQKANIQFTRRAVSEGLSQARWPARMEKLSQEPLLILDGAHNAHAIKRLVENLKQEFSSYKINILFSALATKEVEEMVLLLKKIPNVQLYLTSFDYPKSVDLMSLERLKDSKTTIVSLWQFGLGEILERMLDDELLLVTGSLYFVSQVRELLIELGGNDEEN